jgi:hypothetical protein
MEEKDDIIGCFVSGPALYSSADQETRDLASKQGELFRSYIWGENGISGTLKRIKRETYGKDLELILFQFYVNPLPIELQYLKEIGSYRKKGKSIGIPVFVNDQNFFSKSEEMRRAFLKQAVLQKLDVLAEVVRKKRLDTKTGLLKSDMKSILDSWPATDALEKEPPSPKPSPQGEGFHGCRIVKNSHAEIAKRAPAKRRAKDGAPSRGEGEPLG